MKRVLVLIAAVAAGRRSLSGVEASAATRIANKGKGIRVAGDKVTAKGRRVSEK